MTADGNRARPGGACQRKKKFIDPEFQLRYSFTLAIVATVEGIVLAGVLLAAMFSIIEISPQDHVRLFYYIVAVSAAMILLLNLVNIAVGIRLSHRISGPIYRFTQVAKSVAAGDLSHVIKLRDKDELQDLRGQLNEMLDGLRGLVREQNRRLDLAAETVKRMQAESARTGAGPDEQAWRVLLAGVEEAKGKFRI